ncbi:MAG: hypothetical protein HGA77_04760 [Chlorobiaceae bacterium]|nr:hypothetical protein [Chlorobiaceae bacterium]
MAEDNGFIVMHRKILEWEWYTDTNTKCLFLHLLLRANHKGTKCRGESIKRGQVLTGRKQLAIETGLSEQEIRTSLSKLKSTNEITIRSTKQYSVVTINNYNKYQDKTPVKQPTKQPTKTPTSNQQSTNDQPTSNQRSTTYNNDNKIKKNTLLTESKEAAQPERVLPANPGFSQDFMDRVWPFYLKTGKAKYKNADSQSVALRTLYKEAGGNEQEAIDALQYAVANGYQGFQWYFKHKSKTNGLEHGKRNGTLGYQQPVSAQDLPGIMQSIANDPRFG